VLVALPIWRRRAYTGTWTREAAGSSAGVSPSARYSSSSGSQSS
jgi:hypothetical protein